MWQMVPGTKLVAAERSLLPDDVLGDSGVAHGEAAEMGDLSQPPVDPRRSSDASPAFGLMNTGCAPKSASSAASSGSSGHVRFLHEHYSQQNLMKMISPSPPCLMKRSSVSEWSDQSWRPQSGGGANENASIKERQS